ncbi:MAG: response regulator, partial [Desulfobacterales bacterium]|nr:response regulator [Desulfobacterales bacterium]
MDGAAGQILIVDDTPENIKIIAEILKQDGYGISFANSGQKALDIIRLTPPDLVLLDIVMPGMDGFETCRKIKADPDTALLPVIFLSNITDSKKVVEGLKIGAVDYLNKPVQKDILLARVKTHLTIRSFQKDLEVKVDERTQDLSNALQQIDDIIMSMPSVVISLDEKG